eukprot:GHVU01059493.1.p1 GENE.GHVU01059493.1~~GHVU01059493.1.p1  ORF type:complete len:110 (-),score=8.45 GHVU01059493.1:117-446(-)
MSDQPQHGEVRQSTASQTVVIETTVDEKAASEKSDAEVGKSMSSQDKCVHPDPIRWFGILVPPALRAAQSFFVSSVEDSVPRLIELGRDLRVQEIRIGRLQKQIARMPQ